MMIAAATAHELTGAEQVNAVTFSLVEVSELCSDNAELRQVVEATLVAEQRDQPWQCRGLRIYTHE
jgi:hypothetical protein